MAGRINAELQDSQSLTRKFVRRVEDLVHRAHDVEQYKTNGGANGLVDFADLNRAIRRSAL